MMSFVSRMQTKALNIAPTEMISLMCQTKLNESLSKRSVAYRRRIVKLKILWSPQSLVNTVAADQNVVFQGNVMSVSFTLIFGKVWHIDNKVIHSGRDLHTTSNPW